MFAPLLSRVVDIFDRKLRIKTKQDVVLASVNFFTIICARRDRFARGAGTRTMGHAEVAQSILSNPDVVDGILTKRGNAEERDVGEGRLCQDVHENPRPDRDRPDDCASRTSG